MLGLGMHHWILEILIALVLSQNIEIDSSYFTCMSFKVCFI